MKTRFFLLTALLLFARGCDFYSTSLWFFDDPSGEQNPLYKYFGFGWSGLILVNVFVVGLIIYAFYYYSFRYKRTIINTRPSQLTDYVSEVYFYEKGRFLDVFYRIPRNRKALLAHSGYVTIRVITFVSFLATIHNLCQFYNVSFYNSFREIVGRPLYVIYGLMILSFFYFAYRLWKKEFELSKIESNNMTSRSQ